MWKLKTCGKNAREWLSVRKIKNNKTLRGRYISEVWLSFGPAVPPYVHPCGRYVSGNIGHAQNCTQTWPKIFNICWSIVPGGCTYWPALWGNKNTYLGFQSIIVSILDHMFKYRILGLICRTPENTEFLHIFPKNAQMPPPRRFHQIST